MTQLTIYFDTDTAVQQRITDYAAITAELAKIEVLLEHWQTPQELAVDATEEVVLQAYQADIKTLNQRFGFNAIDVVAMHPDHPDKAIMRDKFLHEHIHKDFEVRFFVAGQGLFYIRQNGQVYAILCHAGDLISVPANTTHWFDMGPQPFFKAIRFFTAAEGWVGHFTGDNIADKYPRLETA